MRLAQSLGWAMVVAAALIGTILAVGLLEWETAARSARSESLLARARSEDSSASTSLASRIPPPLDKLSQGKPGAAAFRFSCEDCHPGGKQGRGPALAGSKPDVVARIVRDGSVEMPSYSVEQISEADLADLITFVTALR